MLRVSETPALDEVTKASAPGSQTKAGQVETTAVAAPASEADGAWLAPEAPQTKAS
jgi:hypothetical protein